MNEKAIKRTAKKFIKSLKRKVDFVSIEEHLKSKYNYKVIFFNTPAGDKEVLRYNLTEEANATDSFTYSSTAKIIFINNNCSCDEKLYLLYHEAAHIVLKHIDYPRLSTKNKVLLDIEADVFAYNIIHPPKLSRTGTALITTVVFLAIANLMPAPTAVNTSQNLIQNQIEYVLITPGGRKYHRENCIYVKGKECSTITKDEAENTHAPCLVCNP